MRSFQKVLGVLAGSFLLVSGGHAFATPVVDKVNHTVTVSPSANSTQNTNELRSAFGTLINRTDKTTPWTLRLNPGRYVLSAQVSAPALQNTTVTSADMTNPAIISKMAGWNSATSAEYLLNFRMGKNISLVGVNFYGQTDFANNATAYWPDQGVYFGSCNIVKVDHNKFYNFGNAALRVTTDDRDPVSGVNSFRTMVSNNTFDNFYQTSTTVQDNIHGGTAMSSWVNNTFTRIRGSVKFASRTPGATNIEFINNTLDTGDHFGLEINNYSNFILRENTIKNIKGVSMNIYSGAIPGFAWGDNFTIDHNIISNTGRGIRYSHEAGTDGFQSVPKNLIIDSNLLDNVHDSEAYVPAIFVQNGAVNGVTITNNKLSNISNKNYIGVTKNSTNVSILNNFLDGKPYGTQSLTK